MKHTIEVGPEAPGSQIRRRRTAANRCTALDTGHRDPWQRQPVPWRRDPAIAAWWTLNDLGLLTDPRWRQVIEDTLRGPV
ncbi:MAG TPA: hypothetical protein VMI11_14060 [Actinomycetes bacterium]|nr:hypothetical protein [Actinomycetes bacterium]